MRHITTYVLTNPQIAKLKTMAFLSTNIGSIDKTIQDWVYSVENDHRSIRVYSDRPHERMIANRIFMR